MFFNSKNFNSITVKSEKEILDKIIIWMADQEKDIRKKNGVIRAISHSIGLDPSFVNIQAYSGSAIIYWEVKQ